jgi:hypothetical protein
MCTPGAYSKFATLTRNPSNTRKVQVHTRQNSFTHDAGKFKAKQLHTRCRYIQGRTATHTMQVHTRQNSYTHDAGTYKAKQLHLKGSNTFQRSHFSIFLISPNLIVRLAFELDNSTCPQLLSKNESIRGQCHCFSIILTQQCFCSSNDLYT